MSQYPFEELTGSGLEPTNAALDGVPYSGLTSISKAFGNSGSNFLFYKYNPTNNNTTNPEDGLLVIIPNDNVTSTGAWNLLGLYSSTLQVPNNIPVKSLNSAGVSIISLIKGTAADKVGIDPNGVGTVFGGVADVNGKALINPLVPTLGTHVGDRDYNDNRYIAAGGPIAFPATAIPSSDPNTLDDYEEGTWTPIAGGTATYTTQLGFYTKIGNKITVTFNFVINIMGTGGAAINGLPFTSNDDAVGGYGSISALTDSLRNFYSCQLYVAPNTSSISTLHQNALDKNITAAAMLTDSSVIKGGVTYFSD